ncbi:MAG: 6-carboxytetrahydropterin synthase [Myxococcota bacterium]|jgi:6-pyruvoyltetrahydropterin/6-carboxytetrahydropterin synthase|nr:6-carboxytetrahydropterin synthase [Myxococcota bacterium]
MPLVRLTRAIEFSASLRYRAAGLSDGENREVFGLAAEQHGHNYRLEVTVKGEPDPRTGMVMNLVDLKAILEREVMGRFDHRDLNADTDFFKDIPPTPENLAAVIHELLVDALPAGRFDRLRLYQDADLYVDVVD